MELSEGMGQDNQLIITGEDGQGYPVSVSGMITVPMSSMYQMVANIQHLHQNGDGTVCLTPIQVSNPGGGSSAPNAKYQMLRAVAPGNNTKSRGNGLVTADGVVEGTRTGQGSTGLGNIMEVIQVMKNENDCNNNDDEDVVEEEEEEDDEEDIDEEDLDEIIKEEEVEMETVPMHRSSRVQVVNTSDGQKRFVVRVKQK